MKLRRFIKKKSRYYSKLDYHSNFSTFLFQKFFTIKFLEYKTLRTKFSYFKEKNNLIINNLWFIFQDNSQKYYLLF